MATVSKIPQYAVEGLKIRTLTNHIALKQWTCSSTLWSLTAAHLAVGRLIENVQCIKRRSFHFYIYNVATSCKGSTMIYLVTGIQKPIAEEYASVEGFHVART
jgi:hypothetical protein